MRKIFFLLPLLLLFSGTLLATGGEKGTILRTVFSRMGRKSLKAAKVLSADFSPARGVRTMHIGTRHAQ